MPKFYAFTFIAFFAHAFVYRDLESISFDVMRLACGPERRRRYFEIKCTAHAARQQMQKYHFKSILSQQRLMRARCRHASNIMTQFIGAA